MIFIREVMEQAVLKIFTSSYTQTQLLKVRLALKEQENPINSSHTDHSSNKERLQFGAQFLQLDNEFHSLLFHLAGKGQVWELLKSHSSHYERFRTLINWSEHDMLSELYKQHCDMIDAIVSKDSDRLTQIISNHIYSGFSGNADIVLKNTDYFSPGNCRIVNLTDKNSRQLHNLSCLLFF